MKETSRGMENEIDIDYEMSVIDQETERTILERYPLHEQLNITRLALLESYKKDIGLEVKQEVVAQALEANAFIEQTRENGRIKKQALTN